ncbi:hypothetical protein CBR_g26187 [Chara braunii]|uniref:Uncharacterized protein n=1 Tax=Chara braunii TaxID=69332 RepID=A0A388L7D5_CHABU|nr:hypothetical protein CBR_g26187 [Chara braunii]|eukprot:GBG78152.1 hypothetical protein CBR_g26187 [Chara braunii]
MVAAVTLAVSACNAKKGSCVLVGAGGRVWKKRGGMWRVASRKERELKPGRFGSSGQCSLRPCDDDDDPDVVVDDDDNYDDDDDDDDDNVKCC